MTEGLPLLPWDGTTVYLGGAGAHRPCWQAMGSPITIAERLKTSRIHLP